jgi:predicted homoserine dehydrogenase-like protein
MNISQLIQHRDDRKVALALVGAGEFGSTLVSMAAGHQLIDLKVVCDRDPERAIATLTAAGFSFENLAHCGSQRAGLRAIEHGRVAIVEDAVLAAALPVDVVVESTGQPEAAAKTAMAAIANGRHLVLATKELESIAGPVLSYQAKRNGCIHTPADGDQPSLLVGLIGWARLQGFEVVAAGKSTSARNDLIWIPGEGRLQLGSHKIRAPQYGALFEPIVADLRAHLRARRVEGLPLSPIVDDLCEIAIVANHSDLAPDGRQLHAPVARAVELCDIFRPEREGGLLRGTGVLDMFRGLRTGGELPFAGGVFVTVRTPSAGFGRKFSRIGTPASADGAILLLHNPMHLLGAEAIVSALSAARLRCATGNACARQRYDLVARAQRDFSAGECIQLVSESEPTAAGNIRHSIAGLEGELSPASVLGEDAPVPYYLAVDRTLVRSVARGSLILGRDLAPVTDSALWNLRREQDHLLGAGAS